MLWIHFSLKETCKNNILKGEFLLFIHFSFTSLAWLNVDYLSVTDANFIETNQVSARELGTCINKSQFARNWWL